MLTSTLECWAASPPLGSGRVAHVGNDGLFTFAAASVRQQQIINTMATVEGIQPLALSFDLSCPIPLPERPALIQWPWPIA